MKKRKKKNPLMFGAILAKTLIIKIKETFKITHLIKLIKNTLISHNSTG